MFRVLVPTVFPQCLALSDLGPCRGNWYPWAPVPFDYLATLARSDVFVDAVLAVLLAASALGTGFVRFLILSSLSNDCSLRGEPT